MGMSLHAFGVKGLAMTSIQPNSAVGMQPAAPQAPAQAARAAEQVTEAKPGVSLAGKAPAAKEPQERPAEPPIDPKKMRRELEAAIERLNEQAAQSSRSLGFSIDEKIDVVIIRVTNKETGELIRQIPAEAVIRFAHSLEDLRGILFDAEL